MIPLSLILDEQDRRDLHAQNRESARINHLGLSDHRVHDVLDAVRNCPQDALRSGHIGNWDEISAGRVGLVDYNRYICRDFSLGVPTVHAHTFTETLDLEQGDTIYLPAGQIRDRRYERLPLYVKSNNDFIPLNPQESVCAAFSLVETGSGMQPLVQMRAKELSGFPGATTIPTLLCENETLLHLALTALLENALNTSSRLSLEDLFASSVNFQGNRGLPPLREGTGFRVSATYYASPEELVRAALLALRFGSLSHEDAFQEARPQGVYLPLLGATALLGLLAFMDCSKNKTDTHIHWGAVSMSGYPPLSGGYFGRRSNRKTLRLIADVLNKIEEFRFPLRFVLLPAPILSLLPPAEFTQDCELVNELLESVLHKTSRPKADPSLAIEEINTTVEQWLSQNLNMLSAYYLNRFGLARSVFNGTGPVPTDGAPHLSEAFASLNMRQANIVMGCLMQISARGKGRTA